MDARRGRGSSAKRWLATRTWLALAMAPFLLYWGARFASYRRIPDALYGGDSYAQLGIVMHLRTGHAPWTDPAFPGEWAFRDWLFHALAALVSALTGADPHQVMLYWPLANLALGGLVLHALGRQLFRREAYAVGLAIAGVGIEPLLLPTSRAFATMVTVPLFVLALVRLDASSRRRIELGLAYGAASLTYLVAFFGATLMLLLVFLRGALARARATSAGSGWPRALARAAAERARFLLPVAAAGLPVVLLLWGPLLLAYGGDVRNPAHLYADNARGWTAAQALDVLRSLFFDTSTPFQFAYGLAAAAGVAASVARWGAGGGRWALLVLVTGLVGTYHYLVTMPLLGNHLVYYRFPQVFLRLAAALLVLQAAAWAGEALLRRASAADGARLRKTAGPAIAVGLLLAAGLGAAETAESGFQPQWLSGASQTSPPLERTLAAYAWVGENTPRDAVVLSLERTSFGLHALTGKKLVVQRRSHANPFVDLDARFADAAVMIFGKNESVALDLARRYRVEYAIVDEGWDESLQIYPHVTHPSYAPYWTANGVEFEATVLPYDWAGSNTQRFDVIRARQQAPGPLLARHGVPVFENEEVLVLRLLLS